MRIATMVRGFLPVPKPLNMSYAPIDAATMIAEGLAKKGHEVDFFAPSGSKLKYCNVQDLETKGPIDNAEGFHNLLSDIQKAYHYYPALWDYFFAANMFSRAAKGEYDILHFHHLESALPLAYSHPDIPVVYTYHDPKFGWIEDMYDLYRTSNQHFVSISNSQQLTEPRLPYIGTVYNGVDINRFAFNEEADDYLIIVGRILPEKGIKEAVEVTRKADMKLLIFGEVYPDSQEYFDTYVKPYLNDKIQYFGYVENSKLPEYLKKAKAFLMPIQWQEPFGLVMIEAMACGTPVVGMRMGSVPEVVKDGVSGFVVDDVDGMVEAVKKIDTIDRKKCRQYVEDNFSNEIMINNYEKVFEEVIRRAQSTKRRKVQLTSSRKVL